MNSLTSADSDYLFFEPAPQGNCEIFSEARNRSQPKRRKLARRGNLRKACSRLVSNFHTRMSAGFNPFRFKIPLQAVQQERLDVKNMRREQNGLPPLKTYAEI